MVRPAADERASPPSQAAPRRANAQNDEDDEDEWQHEPVAPVDERNPLKSLGRAVADVATGGSDAASKPKQPD